MTQNWKTGPGKLEFRAYEKVKVVLHASEDVPFLNHPQQEQEIIPWGNIFDMRFQVKEIKNDPYVKKVSISQRNCRFPDENYLQTYSLYSYSACVVDCRAQAQIQYCNCLHHFMPKIAGVATCNLTGLICLSNVSDTLRSLRTADYTEKLGLVCDCLPSCNEPEYTIVSRTTGLNEEYNETIYGRFGSKISIEMDSLPKEQFIRKVVRSPLELVVSMGGTIGFFLGASLLSIAEFFYYFFIRKLVDRKRSSVLSHKPELTIKTNKTMKNKKSKNIKQERMAIPYIN
ncbi:sodium channel protein Nach-like [Macrosteles quadrilineatus]|uniref:sodium channel protein Nach-like n=1 Tax=Macrosteles quadrilineatus TaxID=74068 RepID=UPI0023E16CE3|nr:sodium channel protein Nach-like [Macrosteles quadrilineatus]